MASDRGVLPEHHEDYTYYPKGATLLSSDEARVTIERWSPAVRNVLVTSRAPAITISERMVSDGDSLAFLSEFAAQISSIIICEGYRGSLDVLYDLPNLTSIQTSAVEDIDFSRLGALRSCFLTEVESVGNINAAPRLESLRLMRVRLRSLDALEGLVNLRELYISEAARLRSLRGLESLPLREVRLHYLRALEAIEPLTVGAPLASLELFNAPRVLDADAVGRIRTLQRLAFVKVKLASLQFIEALSDLELFSVGRTLFGESTVSLDPAARLLHLRELCLQNIKSAVGFETLQELSRLEVLVIGFCGSMASFDWLSRLSNLRKVYLFGLFMLTVSSACAGVKRIDALGCRALKR